MTSNIRKLNPGIFVPATSRWVLNEASGKNTQTDTLTLATFNIWFGEFFTEERYEAICSILKKHHPDVIALQEVTPASLTQFLKHDWIRDEYYSSDVNGKTLGDYGTIILSRLPISSLQLITLHSTMERHFLVAEITINDAIWKIGTVHLESHKTSATIRGIQLESIFEILEPAANVVIMGDFNFCSSWSENERIDPAYIDIWSHLRGSEPGYTEDTDINLMRYSLTGKHKQVRFDRVLLKNDCSENQAWEAQSIELLGTQPISPQLPNIFPSDHFGLLCRLKKRPSPAIPAK